MEQTSRHTQRARQGCRTCPRSLHIAIYAPYWPTKATEPPTLTTTTPANSNENSQLFVLMAELMPEQMPAEAVDIERAEAVWQSACDTGHTGSKEGRMSLTNRK